MNPNLQFHLFPLRGVLRSPSGCRWSQPGERLCIPGFPAGRGDTCRCCCLGAPRPRPRLSDLPEHSQNSEKLLYLWLWLITAERQRLKSAKRRGRGGSPGSPDTSSQLSPGVAQAARPCPPVTCDHARPPETLPKPGFQVFTRVGCAACLAHGEPSCAMWPRVSSMNPRDLGATWSGPRPQVR